MATISKISGTNEGSIGDHFPGVRLAGNRVVAICTDGIVSYSPGHKSKLEWSGDPRQVRSFDVTDSRIAIVLKDNNAIVQGAHGQPLKLSASKVILAEDRIIYQDCKTPHKVFLAEGQLSANPHWYEEWKQPGGLDSKDFFASEKRIGVLVKNRGLWVKDDGARDNKYHEVWNPVRTATLTKNRILIQHDIDDGAVYLAEGPPSKSMHWVKEWTERDGLAARSIYADGKRIAIFTNEGDVYVKDDGASDKNYHVVNDRRWGLILSVALSKSRIAIQTADWSVHIHDGNIPALPKWERLG